MGKRKLLLAEGNEEFAMALERALGEHFAVRICTDAQAVQMLAPTFLPDVLVLDMLLPGMNSIDLLDDFLRAGLDPMVLVTTRFTDDDLVRLLMEYGVGCVMLKPCSVRKMARHIPHLSMRLHPRLPAVVDPRNRIAALLRSLRIPVKCQGYFYLLEAIARIAESPDQSFCKELYPAVAQLRSVGWESVERCIRTVIVSAWRIRDDRVWRQYFPSGSLPQKHPTNAEFICRLAQYISETPRENTDMRF